MIETITRFYTKIEKYFLIFLMWFMAVNMFLQVALRYLFGYPLPFGEELSRYLQIWIMFFGLVFVLRNNAHIRMGLFYDKVSPVTRKVIDIITNLCVLSALIIFFPGSVDYFKNQIPVSWLGIKWMSMAVTAFAIPASAVMLIFYYVINTVKTAMCILKPSKSSAERGAI